MLCKGRGEPCGMDRQQTRQGRAMARYWDERARENALYYIATYRDYESRDLADFFARGAADVERAFAIAGYTPTGRERLLEIGCGVGRMTRALAERLGEVDALDVSAEMIRQARDFLADVANVRLHVGSGSDLGEFADGAFDVCLSYVVFQHIPEPAITLNYVREMGRVLRPGGRAIFQLSTDRWPRALAPWRARAGVVRHALATGWPRRGPRLRAVLAAPFSGARVGVDEVRQAAAAGGLSLRVLQGAGTRYTWCEAIKGPD